MGRRESSEAEQSGRVKFKKKVPLAHDTLAKVARGSVKTTHLMHSLKLFALYDVNTPHPWHCKLSVKLLTHTPCSPISFSCMWGADLGRVEVYI